MTVEPNHSWRVAAPARLHFGLFSIGNETELQYGGAGLMIDGPRTIVRAAPAQRLQILGPQAERVRQTLAHWRQHGAIASVVPVPFPVPGENIDELPLRIEVESTAPAHSGFGSGTQLALATIVATCETLGLPRPGVEELAVWANRGKRSAIGTHGFYRGGFLVDRGKPRLHSSLAPGRVRGLETIPELQPTTSRNALSPLDLQVSFPESWRIVTIVDPSAVTVFGKSELAAFQSLPPTRELERHRMVELMKGQIAPALAEQNFEQFSKALYEFGYRSGLMFEPIQKSAFNGPQLTWIIEQIRSWGIAATGQSSWGPCVYAITDSLDRAKSLSQHLTQICDSRTEIAIRKADNLGVRVQSDRTQSSAQP